MGEVVVKDKDKDSPQSLLREQSIDSAKIAAWARNLLRNRMGYLQKVLDLSSTPERERAAAAAELVEIMKAMNDAVYKAAPFLMAKGAGGGDTATPSVEAIMAEIVQGKKPK